MTQGREPGASYDIPGNDYGSVGHWRAVADALRGREADTPGVAARAVNASVAALAQQYRLECGSAAPVAVDIGAGQGHLTQMLVASGYDTLMVDLAAGPMTAVAGRRGVHCVVMDAARPAVRADWADLAVVCRGLWCFHDPQAVIRSAYASLRPGATLIVQLWQRPVDCRLLTLGPSVLSRAVAQMYRPSGTLGPFDFDVPTTRAMCEEAGFRYVTTESHCLRWRARDLLPVSHYWEVSRGLAETAEATLATVSEGSRRRIDTALARVLESMGEGAVALSWSLLVMTRPIRAGAG